MKKEFDLRLFLSRALLMLFCLVLSLFIWLFSAWLASPKEAEDYELLSVAAVGSDVEAAKVSDALTGTMAALFRYENDGVTL